MTATIIPFPARRIDEREIATQMWELVMAGERDSDEYRRLASAVECFSGQTARVAAR
jgi:hypothetical protein